MAVLEYAGHTLIVFDDRSYRWISVKRLTWEQDAKDEEILAALISNWRYRDNFLSPDSHEQDTETVHGPYRVAEMTPSSFARIEPTAAVAVVDEFCGLYDHPPAAEVRERIRVEVTRPLPESICFRLRELPRAVHEYGSVLLEFRELAAISREANTLLSIVMAID